MTRYRRCRGSPCSISAAASRSQGIFYVRPTPAQEGGPSGPAGTGINFLGDWNSSVLYVTQDADGQTLRVPMTMMDSLDPVQRAIRDDAAEFGAIGGNMSVSKVPDPNAGFKATLPNQVGAKPDEQGTTKTSPYKPVPRRPQDEVRAAQEVLLTEAWKTPAKFWR